MVNVSVMKFAQHEVLNTTLQPIFRRIYLPLTNFLDFQFKDSANSKRFYSAILPLAYSVEYNDD